jgi:xylulokinase
MDHEPDLVAKSAKFLDTHAFLIHRLTGHFRTSLACADPTGLIDMRLHTWSDDVMRKLGLKTGQFPDLVPPGTIIGRVSNSAAHASGLPAGLKLFEEVYQPLFPTLQPLLHRLAELIHGSEPPD